MKVLDMQVLADARVTIVLQFDGGKQIELDKRVNLEDGIYNNYTIVHFNIVDNKLLLYVEEN